MLHACAVKFDVMFWGEIFWELNTPYSSRMDYVGAVWTVVTSEVWIIFLFLHKFSSRSTFTVAST
jgi:hypothetical protein